MNPAHLIWIIPVSATIGYALALLLIANRLRGDD